MERRSVKPPANEVPNFEAIEEEEKRIRASGMCASCPPSDRRPLIVLPSGQLSTMCRRCRDDLLTGGLAV